MIHFLSNKCTLWNCMCMLYLHSKIYNLINYFNNNGSLLGYFTEFQHYCHFFTDFKWNNLNYINYKNPFCQNNQQSNANIQKKNTMSTCLLYTTHIIWYQNSINLSFLEAYIFLKKKNKTHIENKQLLITLHLCSQPQLSSELLSC